jgi:hypothetical protein
VFAKTNNCSETPDADNLIDLDSNMNVNLYKPRTRSVVGCDPPWRRSTEGRKAQSVLANMSGSSASKNVSRLHETVKRKPVEVRNSASTETACGTIRRSKAITNSEGEHLDVDRTACELHVNNSERAYTTEYETEKNHDSTVIITVVLIDTGAQMSALKRGLIPVNVPICTDKQYEIARTSLGSSKTLGSTPL